MGRLNMYVMPDDITNNLDLSSYYDEDFFNSSIIYQLPTIQSLEYKMSYLSREDLVSNDLYGNPNYLGVVLMSAGSTVEKDSSGDVFTNPEFEPLETVTFKSLSEMREAQLITVSHNPITLKEINPRRNPEYEHYIYDSSKRFHPVS